MDEQPDPVAIKRDALEDGLVVVGNRWGEVHYALNDFCEMLGIDPRTDDWALHREAHFAVVDALVLVAERHGWRGPE